MNIFAKPVMKPEMKTAHMQVTSVYAQLSKARRLKVGAIIVDEYEGNVIGIGYNGTPPGEDNNCEIEPEGWDGDIAKLRTKECVIHAEDNALRKIRIADSYGATMFVTHAPCVPCAKKIVSAGISKVIYNAKYRDEDGIRYLTEHGTEVEQWQIQSSTLSATDVKQSSQ